MPAFFFVTDGEGEMKSQERRRSDASELEKSVTQRKAEEETPSTSPAFDTAEQKDGRQTFEAPQKVTTAGDRWEEEPEARSDGVCLLIA
jgi:hypothetical protein